MSNVNNMLRKFRFVKNELLFLINSSFIFLSCVYQVNREDRLSAFSVYQAKRLSYPIVYQSYRIVRES